MVFLAVVNVVVGLLVVGMLVYMSYAIYKPQLEAGADENQLPEQFRSDADPHSSVDEETAVHNRIRDGDNGQFK